MEENTLSIQPRLREMKVGDVIDYPIIKSASVKNSCSYVAMVYERKFKTKICRQDRTIKVTRIK